MAAAVPAMEPPLRELVAAFAADAAQGTLELPRLSTEQRREAKKVLAEFPELTSESYGLGEDRRLHLFKVVSSPSVASSTAGADFGCVTPAYSVKNTFIDDFVQEASAEAVIFRSIPVRLGGVGDSLAARSRDDALGGELLVEGQPSVLARSNSDSCSSNSTLTIGAAAVAETFGGHEVPSCRWVSPGASTCASPRSSGAGSSCRCPAAEALPPAALLRRALSAASAAGAGEDCTAAPSPLPDGFKVRNTFISCLAGDEQSDSRAVQSMPHGMFRQTLLEDLHRRAAGEAVAAKATVAAAAAVTGYPATPAAAPPALAAPQPGADEPPAAPLTFAPGADVVIFGLQKAPAFNGVSGKVECLVKDAGRYKVLLPAPICGQRFAMVKAENLLPLTEAAAAPPPQCHQPPSVFAPPAAVAEWEWASPEWAAPEWASPAVACGPLATSGISSAQVCAAR